LFRFVALVPLDLERWCDAEVGRGLSLQTISRDIASIKACLSHAVDWDLLAINPLAKVKKSRVNDCVKFRYLSEKEEARLRQALDAREERRRTERDTANHWRRERGYVLLPSMRTLAFTDHLKPLVLLSINTGCRRGDLFDLNWANVDLYRRILTVDSATAKSKRTRHIRLNQEAMSVLCNWQAQSPISDGLVFTNDTGLRFDPVNFS
jgi:integrase